MRGIDFTSWHALLSTLMGLVLVSIVMVGVRLFFMQTIQRRRERENRQINERLRTLIAAYKTLGSSFTGDLAVDPRHRRQWRDAAASRPSSIEEAIAPATADADADADAARVGESAAGSTAAERRRRIRDAVEAALSDIVLLGTGEQVRMAALAAQEMVAGRPVHTAQLVVSLRTFIRQALDLEAIAPDIAIPDQGPLRPSMAGRSAGPGRAGGSDTGSGRGGRAGGGAGGAGVGLGLGLGTGVGGAATAHPPSDPVGADLPGRSESSEG